MSLSSSTGSAGALTVPYRPAYPTLHALLADHQPADVGGHHRRRCWRHGRHLLHCFGEQHYVPKLRLCNCKRSCGPLCSHWTVLHTLLHCSAFQKVCNAWAASWVHPARAATCAGHRPHCTLPSPPATNRPPAPAQPLLALPLPQQPQAPSREAARPAPALRAAAARPPQVNGFGGWLAGKWKFHTACALMATGTA